MENKKKIPTILIIVGITGDLAKRKLLPAICNLIEAKVLPEKFKVLGTTRHEIKQDQFLTDLKINTETKKNIEILNIDLNTKEGNIVLLKKIKEIEKVWKNKVQIIFNLSVPPQATIGILEALAKAKFNLNQRVKLLLEKPFGEDLIGAKKMIKEINKYFNSKQIYRLDHYLAKEMAQNVLVFRKNNPLFRETFNHKFIESIEIIATESIGIEGRVNFFEQTGSLRDLVQSHLLQLAALTLLDINKVKDNSNIQALRAEALNKLTVRKDYKGRLLAKRGQYENYKKEVNNQESFTETFVNLELISKDKN